MPASAEVAVQPPVKGMVFEHARRKRHNGEPVVGTVSSVSRGIVFWVDPLYSDRRIKMRIELWEQLCARVVSVPDESAVAADRGPKLTPAQCKALHAKAHAAGLAAGEAASPMPMVVGKETVMFSGVLDTTKPVYFVESGICGFYYINVRPGTSSFARWAKKHLGAWTGFHGGTQYSVRAFGQSYERKGAYARAYCQVLAEAGIRAYPEGRVD